ncbi:MAG: signal recognition particle protein [Erysipelotrichaceae bacterium]|nr:signal recognition particle protein [Erysipelotrichaceae bacterium]
MAFDSLSNRLSLAFKNIAGNGKLTEKNMDRMLKEVRTALLEADVNYQVVKKFIETIREESMGEKVLSALDPSQMVVKIVHDEIVSLLGEETAEIQYSSNGMTTIMMVGLQGTGKTTSIAKLANLMQKKQNRRPLLIAADVVRPAAIEQLQTLGASIGVEVFTLGNQVSSVETVKQGLEYARLHQYDTVLIDTAGRLHIDEELMQELHVMKDLARPQEILLTVDAMTGQDIVTVAKSFHEQLDVTGLVVTKFDGDSRGGGVLSVRAITQVPVKFVCVGEKMEDIDIFYPERMADRILGMGDIMTLIEQAQEKMDLEASEASAKRMLNGEFTLDDMLVQFKQMKKMGSMSGVLKMIPGMGQLASQVNDEEANERIKAQEAIIYSMTPEERKNPRALRSTHKNRIAKGSGTSVQEVNRLINQFEKTKTQMKAMGSIMRSGRMPENLLQQMQQGMNKKRRF